MATEFPTPEFITGGCLCGSLRYRVDFPADHDFQGSSGTCQCTQCRKQTSNLFLLYHNVTPPSAFKFTSQDTSSLKHYSASPGAQRAFCSNCGSFIYWKPTDGKHISFTAGTVDPLYLFGEGANDENKVPKGGYGLTLANGGAGHYWCANEVPGVSDDIPLLGLKGNGKRYQGD